MGALPLMRRVLLPVLVAASVLGPPEALADGSTRVSAAAAAADQAALLRFEAGGDDPAGTLQGWGRAPGSSGEPCTTASWNVRDSGWHGVMCDGAQGRVTHRRRWRTAAHGSRRWWRPLTRQRCSDAESEPVNVY